MCLDCANWISISGEPICYEGREWKLTIYLLARRDDRSECAVESDDNNSKDGGVTLNCYVIDGKGFRPGLIKNNKYFNRL